MFEVEPNKLIVKSVPTNARANRGNTFTTKTTLDRLLYYY